MKQAIVVVLAALVLLAGGTLFVLSRGGVPAAAPEDAPPPLALLGEGDGEVVMARARAVPLNSVALNFPTKSLVPEGIVSEILVEEGDRVEQGALLAQMDRRDLDLRVEEAQAVLAQAKATYDQIAAGATPQEIERARAQVAQAQAKAREAAGDVTPQDVAAAQAELAAARAALAQAQAGPKSTRVRAAQASVDQARARLQADRDRLSADKTNAQLAMEQAANDLRTRQDTYSRVHWENQGRGEGLDQQNIDREAAALREMQDAEKALEQARIAYEQARQAEVNGVAAAEAAVKNAQAALDELLAGSESSAIAAARAQVAQAEADLTRLGGDQHASALAAVEAEQRSAQATVDMLAAGPREVDLAVAAARIQQAEAALKRSRLALDMAALHAPFAGTVVQLNLKVGEIPNASAPAVILADLSGWQLVADNLAEIDVVRVDEGDPVAIVFDALPGIEMPGRLVRVAALGQESADTRGATYTAYIALDEQDSRLRWNMSAAVSIKPNATSASSRACGTGGCPAAGAAGAQFVAR
jgi:HlyD family secretion protein